eukprot:14344178-Alexandrium_andersonii.AAC.1
MESASGLARRRPAPPRAADVHDAAAGGGAGTCLPLRLARGLLVPAAPRSPDGGLRLLPENCQLL